jgi:3-hydroxybutyryl-CoA dehydratase
VSSGDSLARDFDHLRAGETFASRGRTITEADLVSFSALTGDRHPVHADAVWAQRSQFGARIAHGMLLLSYAVGLAPFDPRYVVALRGVDDATFRRPVHIGDTVHLEGEVEELKEIDSELGLVVFKWRLSNQRGELVVRARVTALWRRETEPQTTRPDLPDEADLREVYL